MLRNNFRKSVLFLALGDVIWLHRYLSISNIRHFDIMLTQTTSDSYLGRTMEVSERPKEKWILLGHLTQTGLSSSRKPELSFLGVWFSSQHSESSVGPLWRHRFSLLGNIPQEHPREETGVPHGRSDGHFPHQHPLGVRGLIELLKSSTIQLPGSWWNFSSTGTTKRSQTLLQMMFMGLSEKKSVSHTEQSFESTWGLSGDLLTKHLMELLQNRGKRENG